MNEICIYQPILYEKNTHIFTDNMQSLKTMIWLGSII